MRDHWGDRNKEIESVKMTQIKSKTQTFEEEKKTPVRMTEVEKRRREERGSCSVWGRGWWDVSLEHERADILMESIIHVKWVTGWVSYFHATRHKVPSISLSQSSTVSRSVFSSLCCNHTNRRYLDNREKYSVTCSLWVDQTVGDISWHVELRKHRFWQFGCMSE